jgi:hypothetical protein
VPRTRARTARSDRLNRAQAVARKIGTRNGESYKARLTRLDAARREECHRLEREHFCQPLIEAVQHDLANHAASRTEQANPALGRLRQPRRRPAARGGKPRD